MLMSPSSCHGCRPTSRRGVGPIRLHHPSTMVTQPPGAGLGFRMQSKAELVRTVLRANGLAEVGLQRWPGGAPACVACHSAVFYLLGRLPMLVSTVRYRAVIGSTCTPVRLTPHSHPDHRDHRGRRSCRTCRGRARDLRRCTRTVRVRRSTFLGRARISSRTWLSCCGPSRR